MGKPQRIVIALGGNAISRPNEEGNVAQQFANSRQTAKALANLIEQGHQLIITHGNGPQIGNFLLRNWAASDRVYPLPMEVAVAHVQGGMGFMIATTLTSELNARGMDHRVTAIVTTILVDHDDPSFVTPTKPIGRILDVHEADTMARDAGWHIREVSDGQYRRLIASPLPKRIMEIETIRRIVDGGDMVIACGGGGVPIVREPDGELRGVRAVIDKDLSSGLLAANLDVDAMLILTNVDRVRINYQKPDERAIEQMTLDQAQTWLDEGQFPPGSMGPKVQGAVDFLSASGRADARVIIGPLDQAAEAVEGRVGTCITKN